MIKDKKVFNLIDAEEKRQEENIYNITRSISKRIEEWINENPEQWLWAHRRWGK